MPGFTSHVSGTATGAKSGHVAIDLYHLAYLIAFISGSFFFDWAGLNLFVSLPKPCVCRVEELLLPRHLTSATLAGAVKSTNYDRGYGRIAAITTPSCA